MEITGILGESKGKQGDRESIPRRHREPITVVGQGRTYYAKNELINYCSSDQLCTS